MIDSQALFNIKTETEFENLALQVFKFQFNNNRIYRSFCDLLYIHTSDVKTLNDIPFLPIQFFKTHEILSSDDTIKATFTSSGTTGTATSKHLVTDLSIYKESFTRGFELFYGPVEDFVILALLPSYLEREGSSLIYMVDAMIKTSKHKESGFYLNNISELKEALIRLDSEGKKVLLIGVSFALLDLVETYNFQLKNTIIMETGGMKGRRKELIREELHAQLKVGFGVNTIHSEYGMTELLSQAYSQGNGIFKCPDWMRVLVRDTEDALSILPENKVGGLNIIDLANINSCAFIATQDLGSVNKNGCFEVIGRFDNSDIRGCNLMVL
ncbi:LuxE/PaaK family acyltransferase [Siansivirga zeaxanthinifaciens]|uniref:Acyl transferase n=1 Tax=Siansivirga zeaxanthinifaciens CC-SAMT-1 TaxID=1454006 RepID=A0A0C5W8N5_9FLAO|nr:acyltransferase [Siansivirga zeaxanthinifaciens]AJR02627.1 acyl transferase [Siansivirga zeaxanthinifaciens CC-SAMT-1]